MPLKADGACALHGGVTLPVSGMLVVLEQEGAEDTEHKARSYAVNHKGLDRGGGTWLLVQKPINQITRKATPSSRTSGPVGSHQHQRMAKVNSDKYAKKRG
jgi:hypothetical protein